MPISIGILAIFRMVYMDSYSEEPGNIIFPNEANENNMSGTNKLLIL